MNRATIVYGVLLAVALAGAYLSWQSERHGTGESPDGAGAPANVVVADIEREAIRRVEWVDGSTTLVLRPRSDEIGDYVRVKQIKDTDDGRRTTNYKGSEAAERVLERLAPLRAQRRLPAEAADAPADYGLDEPRARLTVSTEDDQHRFEIGDYSFGRHHLYLRRADTRPIYVVRTDTLGPLEGESLQLRDSRLTEMRQRDVRRVRIVEGETERGDARTIELLHHNLDDPPSSYWTVGETTRKSRRAGNWMDRFFRLSAREYVSEEQGEQQIDDLETTLTVELVGRDGTRRSVRLMRLEGGRSFARSPFTRGLVRLEDGEAASLLRQFRAIRER